MPFDKVEKAKRRFMADLREGKEPGAPRTDANRAALEEAKKEFAKDVKQGKKSISRATARGEEKIAVATAEGQRQIADATERAIRTLKSLSTASSSNPHHVGGSRAGSGIAGNSDVWCVRRIPRSSTRRSCCANRSSRAARRRSSGRGEGA